MLNKIGSGGNDYALCRVDSFLVFNTMGGYKMYVLVILIRYYFFCLSWLALLNSGTHLKPRTSVFGVHGKYLSSIDACMPQKSAHNTGLMHL